MKTKHSVLTIALLALLFISSCKRPANIPTFVHEDPSSVAYKNELASQLKARPASSLTYIFKHYKLINGKEFFELDITGDGIDATGLFAVTNWENLEGIRHAKGGGYRHAELKGVKIAATSNGLELQNVDSIVD